MRLSLACLATIFASAALADAPPTPREAPPSGSVVSRVSGETVRFVRRPEFVTLVLGQDLLGGDTVSTGSRGVVGILFVDGTVMRLHPDTELVVKSVSPAAVELELGRGTLWARAPRGTSNVTVTTPTAAAGVRGTDWSLSVERGGTTRLTVFDGVVDLKNPLGLVTTRAGEAAVAMPGQPPVKVGVANRRERPQMLYTLEPTVAADLLATTAEALGGAPGIRGPAIARYREGLVLLRQGHNIEAAQVLTAAAGGLDPERAASARWLAAIARAQSGAPLRPPSATGATADAMGAAVAAAMSGDLDRAQTILDSAATVPDVAAAAVQVAILRDDAPKARALLVGLRRSAPGSVAALEAEAAVATDLDGDAVAAAPLLRRAVALAPRRASLWNALGLAELALDHPLEAEAAFRQAIALEPADQAATGNLAILLLDQQRVAEAQALAETMLKRDPGSYLALRALGRAQVQQDNPAATETLLRALTAQPAAAETSIALAVAAQQSGDPVRAAQELDAAGRLDPNDPMVPLIRSITALDAGRADTAITAARRASDLLVAQDGSTRAVAADRQTGSPLANAYQAIALDGWARYTADRTFDPLSASSLFSEGTLDRLTVGRGGPSATGADNALVQGLLLEPLSASYRLRDTDILRRPFFDAEIGFDAPLDGDGPKNALLQVQGLTAGRVPLAYALTLPQSRLDTPGLDDESREGNLLLGAQLSPRFGAVAVIGASHHSFDQETPLGFGLTQSDSGATDSRSIALGGSYRLGGRDMLLFFAGHTRVDDDSAGTRFLAGPLSLYRLDAKAHRESTADVLSVSYRGEDEGGFWIGGLDLTRVHSKVTSAETTTDLIFGGSVFETGRDSETVTGGTLYLDRRQRFGPALTGEALIRYDTLSTTANRAGGRLGLAWQPAEGQMLRAALIADPRADIPTLAPQTVLGLVPLSPPFAADGRRRGALLRYEAALGERVMISVEHQDLWLDNLSYATTDPLITLEVDRARLKVTDLRADWWLGGGVGLYAGVTHAWSRMRDGPYAGAPLPDTPDWTARLGLGWLRPSQFSGRIEAVWTDSRFSGTPGVMLDPVTTVDVGLRWQPFHKRVDIRFDGVNIFDRKVEAPWGAPASGRSLRLALAARF